MSVDMSSLAVVEIIDAHERVIARERITLTPEKRTFTIGRGMQADVIVSDVHLAALHASIEITPEGKILATDLGTVNGLTHGGKHYAQNAVHGAANGIAQALEITDGWLTLGRTKLRVRTAHEVLPPEKPDHTRSAPPLRDPAWIAGIGALAGGLQLAYSAWLGAPRDLATTIATTLISGALAAGAWVAVWALLSRVMQGDWRWLRHAAIFLGVAAVYVAIDSVLELVWFIAALPQWSTRAAWMGAFALGVALYLHLIHSSSLSTRRAAIIACVVPLFTGGLGHWLQARYQTRDVNHIATTVRIYPPALRLRGADTSAAYFQDANTLRKRADERRKSLRADDDDESTDDE